MADGTPPLACCRLCPRGCGVNRLGGERGFCRAGAQAEVYRYGPHRGEEPPLSGRRGSGTVFFSRCTLACLYCQNYPWSQEGDGSVLDGPGLAGALAALRAAGCHNWNVVSPTPWLPPLREAVALAAREGGRLPIVYNTSGYERPEVLEAYRDLADIYLPDLRYASEASGLEGSGVKDYVRTAREALRTMWRLAGPLELDGEGVARRGVICRVLVLPGLAGEAVASLEWLAAEFGPGMAVSVMSQYIPAYRAAGRGDAWGRTLTGAEYARVREAVEALDFDYLWMQEFDVETEETLVGFRMRSGPDA